MHIGSDFSTSLPKVIFWMCVCVLIIAIKNWGQEEKGATEDDMVG